MVIIINGSLGVGKTSVSWALLDLLDQSVMLDGDYFAAVHRFDFTQQQDLSYLFKTLANSIDFHLKHGKEHFIVNYVFESEEQMDELCAHLKVLNQSIIAFRLTCSPEVQEARIIERNNDQKEWELKRYKALNKILNQKKLDGGSEILLDTNGKQAFEVAHEIYNRIRLA